MLVYCRIAALLVLLVLHSSPAAGQGDARFAPQPSNRGFGQAQPRQPQSATPTRRISRPTESVAGNGTADQGGSGVGSSMLKTIACLVLVIGLILVLAKLFGRQTGALRLGLPKDAVEVLGRASLDSRQHIYLVRLGAQLLVLGSSSGELRTLSEITDPVQVDLLAGACKQHSSTPSTGFMDVIRRFSSSPSTSESKPAATKTKDQFQQQLHDRLSTPLKT